MKYLLAIFLLSLIAVSCGRNTVDKEDAAAAEYADISNDTVVTGEYVDTEKWINSYLRAHPDLAYRYMPSDTGRYRTVTGNYTVVVDNLEMVEDTDELYRYFRLKYDERQRQQATFNEGIEDPAVPEPGFETYLQKVDSLISLDGDRQDGTLFVELIIDENGTIDQAEVVEGLYGQDWPESTEIEVLDAVMNTGITWKPARKDGQAVSMRVEIPVEIGKG